MNSTMSTTLNSKAAHNVTFRALHIQRHDADSTVTRIGRPATRDTAATTPATANVHWLGFARADHPRASAPTET